MPGNARQPRGQRQWRTFRRWTGYGGCCAWTGCGQPALALARGGDRDIGPGGQAVIALAPFAMPLRVSACPSFVAGTRVAQPDDVGRRHDCPYCLPSAYDQDHQQWPPRQTTTSSAENAIEPSRPKKKPRPERRLMPSLVLRPTESSLRPKAPPTHRPRSSGTGGGAEPWPTTMPGFRGRPCRGGGGPQPGGSFTLKMVNGPDRGKSFLKATSFRRESLIYRSPPLIAKPSAQPS